MAFIFNNFIFKLLICTTYLRNFMSKNFNCALKHFILFQIDILIKFFLIWIYNILKTQTTVSVLTTKISIICCHTFL